jgi:predicted nucleic acid-binding protein
MAGNRLRIFLDANILFSAAHDPESRSAALITFAIHSGRVALLTSAYALEEATRNLELKRTESLGRLAHLLKSVQIVPEASSDAMQAALKQSLPPSDLPILAAALHANAQYLVTGDRTHFGHLMDHPHAASTIRVLSLASTLRMLLAITPHRQS